MDSFADILKSNKPCKAPHEFKRYIPPKDESEKQNSENNLVAKLSCFLKDENMIADLPVDLRHELKSKAFITRSQHYNSIRQRIIDAFSKARYTCGYGGYEFNAGALNKKTVLEMTLLPEMILDFTREWHPEKKLIEQTNYLLLAVIKLFCVAAQEDICRDDSYTRCRTCVKWDMVRWSRLQDAIIQIAARRCPLILEQVKSELREPSPSWNPEWLSFEDMFPSMPHWIRYNDELEGITLKVKDRLALGTAVTFLSHIKANITAYWQVEQRLVGRNQPREIHDMIFHEVLVQKGVRRLPPTNFTWPFRSEFPWIYNGCTDCSPGCRWYNEKTSLRARLTDWKFEKAHLTYHLPDEKEHSEGCSCKASVFTESEWLVESISKELLPDPSGLWERLEVVGEEGEGDEESQGDFEDSDDDWSD